MEQRGQKNNDELEQKLNRTTKRIYKTRKNIELAEKEAAEFEEIRKLLCNIESNTDIQDVFPPLDSEEDSIEGSPIPLSTTWLTVFNDDLLFCLFNEETICLSNFVEGNESTNIFGGIDLEGSEETFRQLISSRLIEVSMPNHESCPSVSLYVFHLMSVHQDCEFVDACHDFLKFRPFRIHPEDVLTIFQNYGLEAGHDIAWSLDEERLLRKFRRSNGNIDKISKRPTFPFYNVEMVGKLMIDYVLQDFFNFTKEVKFLIRVLGRLVLDQTIRTGHLTPIYSTLLTVVCLKACEKGTVGVNETTQLLDYSELDPLLCTEICRAIVKFVYPDLHDYIVLKTIAQLLKCEDVFGLPRPIGIEEIKYILLKCKRRGETTPLELYSLLQLIASSLPGVTATNEDSMEINAILTQLDRRISQTEDSLDMIRLKRELAKVRNLLANNTTDTRFTFSV